VVVLLRVHRALPARYRPSFERTEQGPTDATEPPIRRDVVLINASRVGDRTHARIVPPSTATSKELSGAAIYEDTMAGVLLLSHCSKIVGSF
jgi:hypothetical protein